jgi:hypothetical protein
LNYRAAVRLLIANRLVVLAISMHHKLVSDFQ